VPAFLSDAWIESLDAAGRSVGVPPPDGAAGDSFVLEQRVNSVPDEGVCTYHVVFGAESVRVCPGPAEQPDVTFTTDYDGAVAIARGETSAQALLAAGRLRVAGDVEALAGRAPVFAGLGDLFSTVRMQTTYR